MTTQKDAIKALEAYGHFVKAALDGADWYVHDRAGGSQWCAVSGGFILVQGGYQQPYEIRGSGVMLQPPAWGDVVANGVEIDEEIFDTGQGAVTLVWLWPNEVVEERYLAAASEMDFSDPAKPRPKKGSFADELSKKRVAENEAIIASEA